MQWIAPSEKDTQIRRWKAALGSGGSASGQFGAYLGAVFDAGPRPDLPAICRGALRQAARAVGEILPRPRKRGRGEACVARGPSRIDDPGAYHAEGVLFLTPNARFDHLLDCLKAAMSARPSTRRWRISRNTTRSSPVSYRRPIRFSTALCSRNCSRKFPRFPTRLDYDAFGRIYEYFLGEFARTEGQKGGEFFTPELHRPADRRDH